MSTTIVAAAILRDVEAGTQLLIARRTSPAPIAGLWEFPGGKLEPGESVRDGVRRELDEELGVEVHLLDEVVAPADPAFDVQAGWRLNERASMRLHTARLVPGSSPMPLQDHDRLDWVLLDDRLHDYPWIPADLPIVDHLIAVGRAGDSRC